MFSEGYSLSANKGPASNCWQVKGVNAVTRFIACLHWRHTLQYSMSIQHFRFTWVIPWSHPSLHGTFNLELLNKVLYYFVHNFHIKIMSPLKTPKFGTETLTKVCNLGIHVCIKQHIFRLEVSVHHHVPVAVVYCWNNLLKQPTTLLFIQLSKQKLSIRWDLPCDSVSASQLTKQSFVLWFGIFSSRCWFLVHGLLYLHHRLPITQST